MITLTRIALSMLLAVGSVLALIAWVVLTVVQSIIFFSILLYELTFGGGFRSFYRYYLC